jgi:hypothetical protein
MNLFKNYSVLRPLKSLFAITGAIISFTLINGSGLKVALCTIVLTLLGWTAAHFYYRKTGYSS